MKNIMKKKVWFFIFAILLLATVINNVYLILNIAGLHGIEDTLRLIGSIILGVLTLLIIFLVLKALLREKNGFRIIMIIVILLLFGLVTFINVNFNIVNSKLNKVTANYTTYSISLVTQQDNEVNDLKGLGTDKIGIINDREIANGYLFGEEIIKENKLSNELVEYESYITILDELKNKTLKYAFLPSNYVEVFQTIEGYENISQELKTIYEKSKQEKEEEKPQKSVTEPFTVLLMGVDSTKDSIKGSSANGDSLILVTFNPNTLKATMVSIPRDSYVPITCMSNKKNKITHSAWGGEKCIINTVSNFLSTKIDYYVKINFTGIVKLVDTLGGVDVNVEYSFCEQNSKRQWQSHTVFVEKGLQTLNGEQALAYARNRHPNTKMCSKKWTSYNSNDFIRGQHQQDIIRAVLTKLKDVRDLDTFYNILDTISNNMETNMDRNTILSFYNVAKDIVIKSKDAKDINELINIQKLYISGKDASIYDYSQYTKNGMRMNLYEFIPSTESVAAVVKAMKVNLGQEKSTPVKTFSYDANNPYTEKVIGKGLYGGATVDLLPDFTGKSKSYVEQYAKDHNLGTPKFIEKDSDKAKDTVLSQDPPSKIDLNNINPNVGLTITISSGKKTSSGTDYSVCKTEEGKNNDICKINIASYIGKLYKDSGLNYSYEKVLSITLVEITEGATKDNDGRIISLNDKTSGYVDLTEDTTLKIKYYKFVESSQGSEQGGSGSEQGGGSQEPGGSSGSSEQGGSSGSSEGTQEPGGSSSEQGGQEGQGEENNEGSD